MQRSASSFTHLFDISKMETVQIIICDALMTICLASMCLSLAALLLGWVIRMCFKKARTESFGDFLKFSFAMVLLFSYLAYDHFFFNYYAGYQDTRPIADTPGWIIQFHCYREYDAQKAETVQMVAEAMSYNT